MRIPSRRAKRVLDEARVVMRNAEIDLELWTNIGLKASLISRLEPTTFSTNKIDNIRSSRFSHSLQTYKTG